MDTGGEIHSLEGHADPVRPIRFSIDSRFITSYSADKTIVICDVETRTIMRKLVRYVDTVNDVQFSPELESGSSSILVSCSATRRWSNYGTCPLETPCRH
jgi:WD40 repeat protein